MIWLPRGRAYKKRDDMKAWITIRNGTENIENPFVTILSARKSPEQVRQIVEQFYAAELYSPQEKFDMARYKKPRSNPYPAKFPTHPWKYFITCGHNPWLEALYADVELVRDANSRQNVKYIPIRPAQGHKSSCWKRLII